MSLTQLTSCECCKFDFEYLNTNTIINLFKMYCYNIFIEYRKFLFCII